MPTYKGVIQKGSLVKSSHPGISVVLVSAESVTVSFPKDVRMAYVQATNRFLDDRIRLGPLTVYSVPQKPNELVFENGSPLEGGGKWLCFQVETT